jgi:hypothetical protein
MLARIPFWGWLLIIITSLYLVYNPLGYSVWHMWTMYDPTVNLPFKLLGTIMLASVVGLVVHGTHNQMNWLGLVVMVALVAVTLWSVNALVAFEIFSLVFWSWALQPILGLILTIGWQWAKIWRRSTGAVSVNDPDTPA